MAAQKPSRELPEKAGPQWRRHELSRMNPEDSSRSLVPLPDASLAVARPQAGRVLSEMLSDTLALARGEPLRKIGEYEWCEPDYRQILLWAEALELEPEEVIRRLLDTNGLSWILIGESWTDFSGDEAAVSAMVDLTRTAFSNGRLTRVTWDLDLLPLSAFTWIEGLEIECLRIKRRTSLIAISHLSLLLPKLRRLDCGQLGIETLDLSSVPALEELFCGDNRLAALDFSNVPLLSDLHCSNNNLATLDLAQTKGLRHLDCSANQLRKLDIGGMTALESLDVCENPIPYLDARGTPMHSGNISYDVIIGVPTITIDADDGTYYG